MQIKNNPKISKIKKVISKIPKYFNKVFTKSKMYGLEDLALKLVTN